MVVPAAAIATAALSSKAKDGTLGAGGEVSALALVRDEAGAATRRLKGVTEALSQATEALSQVRRAIIYIYIFFLRPWPYVCSAGG
jgi:hypothetical protein